MLAIVLPVFKSAFCTTVRFLTGDGFNTVGGLEHTLTFNACLIVINVCHTSCTGLHVNTQLVDYCM